MPPEPFFYCEHGNSVLLAASHRKEVERLKAQEQHTGKSVPDSELEELWHKFIETSPACPIGGSYTFWANVKCPHCATEFPYNQGIKDVHLRLHETNIILVDGAIVVGDSPAESWQVQVDPIKAM